MIALGQKQMGRALSGNVRLWPTRTLRGSHPQVISTAPRTAGWPCECTATYAARGEAPQKSGIEVANSGGSQALTGHVLSRLFESLDRHGAEWRKSDRPKRIGLISAMRRG